ncbi:hypothetical protein Hanom_Chr09g00795611 [Helianthus anomalus]
MLPLVFTTVVVGTPNPVSTPLFSSATPKSLFDSPIGVFSASEKEMPAASVACDLTSARDTAVSDAGGSRSGFVDDGASTYVEGLNYENLMNASMVDAVSQPLRLVEIRSRWMHDNNEFHLARVTIQEPMDEKYRLES